MNVDESSIVAAKPAETHAPLAAVTVILLDSLAQLAETGEVDAACRLAGRACVKLRADNPALEQRFNALLHRLTRRLPGGAT